MLYWYCYHRSFGPFLSDETAFSSILYIMNMSDIKFDDAETDAGFSPTRSKVRGALLPIHGPSSFQY